MRKLTALFVASTLALGAANLAHAADTTTSAPADAKPMMHHKGKFGPHQDMMFKDLNLTDAQKQQINFHHYKRIGYNIKRSQASLISILFTRSIYQVNLIN